MHPLLRAVLLPKSFFEGSSKDRRRSLLISLLWMAVFFALLFYFIPHPDYEPEFNLLGATGYIVLAVAMWLGAPFVVTAHISLVWSLLYLGSVALRTGGINSPVMTWATVAILSAILLLHRAAAIFWVTTLFVLNFLLLVATQQGWVNGAINTQTEALIWSVTKNIFVISLVVYMVYVTKHMHQQQVKELEQNNLALEEVDQALQRAQVNKEAFVASVGHELRTPMNAILGLNDLLRKEVSGRPEEESMVKRMRASTEELLSLVNDILDFSQLQAGRLRLQAHVFSLADVLTEVLAHSKAEAIHKGLQIEVTSNIGACVWVRADRIRLVQLLDNLFDNAVQVTKEGRIHIELSYDGQLLRCEVEDNGRGLDTSVNGLGLSLCEGLVRLQGGCLTICANVHQGTKICFDLPLPSASQEDGMQLLNNTELETGQASSWQNQPMSVLLVDDNAVNLMVIRMAFKKCFPHATLVEASGGAMALEKLKEQSFDLMLIDVLMPDIDGMHVTQALRHRFAEPMCHMPVLAVTANVNAADHDQYLAAGMNDVLHKPLSEGELLNKVSQVLTAHAAWNHR